MKHIAIRAASCALAAFVAIAVHTTAGFAAQQLLQLTDDSNGDSCASFNAAASADGSKVAFESLCDLTPGAPGNADGSREIFLKTFDGGIEQLTDASGCSSSAPAIDADGAHVAFESDCDLVPGAPGNSDGGVEIFLYSAGSPLRQLTDALDCASLAPSISADGGVVAFDSDCNHTEQNGSSSRNGEIFAVDTGAGGLPPAGIVQLTDYPSFLCDSLDASISNDGTLVSFDSDCDLVGSNEDFAIEIFQVDRTAANPPVDGVTQLTVFGDDTCSSIFPSSNGDGSKVAFESDCDFTGANGDGSEEVFVVEPGAGVTQISDDDGATACESMDPAINDAGTLVAYASYCDPLGGNADESLEIFRARVGGGTSQLTAGVNCSSLAPSVDTDVGRVVFDSDCDLTGGNADGNGEIFSALTCDCGAPLTHFASAAKPLASDALFILQAGVGSLTCALCECDVDSSGKIVASDALAVLNVAVGNPAIVLNCPAP